MGETKEEIGRFLWLTRLVVAGVVLFVGIIALAQLMIFPDVTVRFDTGVGAQQLADVKVKRGGTLDDMPVPLKPGSYFVGWSMTPDGTELVTHLDRLIESTTVYAIWDGVEKYAVLMVNGVVYDSISIFKASSDGLTPSELNERWVLADDENNDGTGLTPVRDKQGGIFVISNNNYSKFLGWQYYNLDGLLEQLLYQDGSWSLRTADGQITPITDENLFYPPNYKTTFNAILEYRKLKMIFYEYGDGRDVIDGPREAPLTGSVAAPQYDGKAANFAYWEIIPGDLWVDTPSVIRDQIKVTTFVPGERIEPSPLWYYLGSKERFAVDDDGDVIVTLVFRAILWDNVNVDQYTIQMVSDTDAGFNKQKIPVLDNITDLSLTQPICYADQALYLYKDPKGEINSYNFVDHDGVIHSLPTSILDTYTKIDLSGNNYFGYAIGGEYKTVIFNDLRGINIKVNYVSASNAIRLRYDYGSGLYELPKYIYHEGQVVLERNNIKIGNVEILPSGEKYLKNGWLFYGWQNKTTGKIYSAGESYPIPNSQERTIEFVAVWREARLLYDFDFDGGEWSSTPDFSMMKGAFGDLVRIVWDIPGKFGYNFVGWELDGVILHPGDYIKVGEKINLLRAVWEPKKINITFAYLISKNSPPAVIDLPANYVFGDSIRLIDRYNNKSYIFNGWEVGSRIYQPGEVLQLNEENVKALPPRNAPQERNGELYIEIWAAQSVATAAIIYGDAVFKDKSVAMNWVTEIPQGDYFFDYVPFKLSNSELDMNGREFSGWLYSVDTSTMRMPITANTIVPSGAETITVYAYDNYQEKTFIVKYLGFHGEEYCNLHQRFEQPICSASGYELKVYGREIDLLTADQISPLPLVNEGGKFVGWAFEPDNSAGNPDIVYNVLNNPNAKLRLSNVDDMFSAVYQVDVDRHTTKTYLDDKRVGWDNIEYAYLLTLYAVYAQESLTITYEGMSTPELEVPVYVGDDHSRSTLGGTTVDPAAAAFKEYGLSVLDDFGLTPRWQESFVGWKLTVPSGVVPALKKSLEDRLWFPGDYLPAVNFNLTFTPVYVPQGERTTLEYGNTKYVVEALAGAIDGQLTNRKITDADIVVFPWGTYTVPTGAITVDARAQRIIVPATGTITLETMAIKADGVTSFYVGDNLVVESSPVVGASLQNYRVKRGYRTWDGENISYMENQTQNYDIDAAWLGLLVRDDTLLAVPSGTTLTPTDLRNGLAEIGVTHIASYAFAENSSLPQIDLAINNLQIDRLAIYTSAATKIILPLSATNVNQDCIGGYHFKLTSVVFGSDQVSQSSYARVENGFVYYGLDKGYLMLVLPGVVTRNLGYNVTRDLLIDSAVKAVNSYAFASCNWTLIGSITADASGVQEKIDLTHLIGVPSTMPLFVHAQNDNIGVGMVQTYIKNFEFTYNGVTQIVKYKFGQDFIAFDPKDDNPYGFKFDKAWHKFVGWFTAGDFFYVGEIHRIGVDSRMLVADTIQLNADAEASWESYPVQFHIYDGINDLEANITLFVDDSGHKYTFEQVVNDRNLLSKLYLPGMNLSFVGAGNVKYQFVGWGSGVLPASGLNGRLWNNWTDTSSAKRILPNGASEIGNEFSTKLNSGKQSNGVYHYYALYDMVTDNLEYKLEGNGYTVSQNTDDAINNIYIPYAKYNPNTGFMVPVMKVAGAFGGLENITIKEIIIGAAVTEIGDGAFMDIDANVIFRHQEPYITLHFPEGTAGGVVQTLSLKIGKGAFRNNKTLTRLDLPTAVSEIGDDAFRNCTALTTVAIKDEKNSSLKRLGNFVFRDDTKMNANAIVSLLLNDTGISPKFDSVGQGIFTNTNLSAQNIVWRNILLHARGLSGSAVVDRSIQTIRGYAFASITGITSIRITNGNTVIEPYAFANLSSSVNTLDLTAVNIDNVYLEAFKGMPTSVNVRVTSPLRWEDKFKSSYPNLKFNS